MNKPALMFVADGRSPTALNWIQYLVKSGWPVHLVSTFPCDPNLELASLDIIPVALSGLTSSAAQSSRGNLLRQLVPPARRSQVRRLAARRSLRRASRSLQKIIMRRQPGLIHAMRIPYEGMLTATALNDFPGDQRPAYVQSIWGNDFTLHAIASPWMGSRTRQALLAPDLVHADCHRDIRLAQEWGYASDGPAVVIPGNGGIRTDIFFPAPQARAIDDQIRIINPRGFRAYVYNEAFFRAIPAVLAEFPGTEILCPNMANEPKAQLWVRELQIESSVRLLPRQDQRQMAALYQQASIVASLTAHDGTPNSLLEALACGCFPVAGDLESIREWIRDGENGLLVDASNPDAISNALLKAANDANERDKAAEINLALVRERADFTKGMRAVEQHYLRLLETRR